jgi:hypothetical protein
MKFYNIGPLFWQFSLQPLPQSQSATYLHMIEQVAWNKSSLLLKTILQSTLTLQLFTMNVKTESFYKSY